MNSKLHLYEGDFKETNEAKNERWVNVFGFPEYEVSTTGRFSHNGKEIRVNDSGRVYFHADGHKYSRYAYRMVAASFLPDGVRLCEEDRLWDNNPKNAALSNLKVYTDNPDVPLRLAPTNVSGIWALNDGRAYARAIGRFKPVDIVEEADGGHILDFISNESRRWDKVVTETFLANPEGASDVIHIDQNPNNYHINNLKWAPLHQQVGPIVVDAADVTISNESAKAATLVHDPIHRVVKETRWERFKRHIKEIFGLGR